MKNLLLLFFILFSAQLSAQEKIPEFPGGEIGFKQFIDSNLVYPDSAKKEGRMGTVYIYFDVGVDGTCSNFQISKGIDGSPDLNEEALRIIRLSPKWIPGEIMGRNVKIGMTVPVRFVLA